MKLYKVAVDFGSPSGLPKGRFFLAKLATNHIYSSWTNQRGTHFGERSLHSAEPRKATFKTCTGPMSRTSRKFKGL